MSKTDIFSGKLTPYLTFYTKISSSSWNLFMASCLITNYSLFCVLMTKSCVDRPAINFGFHGDGIFHMGWLLSLCLSYQHGYNNIFTTLNIRCMDNLYGATFQRTFMAELSFSINRTINFCFFTFTSTLITQLTTLVKSFKLFTSFVHFVMKIF